MTDWRLAELRDRTCAECYQLMSKYDPHPQCNAGWVTTTPVEVKAPIIKMLVDFTKKAEALAAATMAGLIFRKLLPGGFGGDEVLGACTAFSVAIHTLIAIRVLVALNRLDPVRDLETLGIPAWSTIPYWTLPSTGRRLGVL